MRIGTIPASARLAAALGVPVSVFVQLPVPRKLSSFWMI